MRNLLIGYRSGILMRNSLFGYRSGILMRNLLFGGSFWGIYKRFTRLQNCRRSGMLVDRKSGILVSSGK